jgi:hypothetical protein
MQPATFVWIALLKFLTIKTMFVSYIYKHIFNSIEKK